MTPKNPKKKRNSSLKSQNSNVYYFPLPIRPLHLNMLLYDHYYIATKFETYVWHHNDVKYCIIERKEEKKNVTSLSRNSLTIFGVENNT